jgi:hypothetical protein
LSSTEEVGLRDSRCLQFRVIRHCHVRGSELLVSFDQDMEFRHRVPVAGISRLIGQVGLDVYEPHHAIRLDITPEEFLWDVEWLGRKRTR